MAGECDKCGEHDLECKCGIGCDPPGTKIKVGPIKPIESLPIPRRWKEEAKEMFPLDVIGIDEKKLERYLHRNKIKGK